MSKGIALPISDMRLDTNQKNDIFPGDDEGKNVFTPPDDGMQQDDGNKFFITEDNNEYPGPNRNNMQQHEHEEQDPRNVIREMHSEESGVEGEGDKGIVSINEAERQIQDKNMFDDMQQENIDFGKAKMDEFKKNAVDILLNENETDYETPLDLPGAYKVLKGLIKNPVIVHSKRPNKGYMKQTFATSRHAVAVKGDEERFLEYSKLSKQSKIEQSKAKLGIMPEDDLKLPPILAIQNGETEYHEPTLLEKLEGFSGKPVDKVCTFEYEILKILDSFSSFSNFPLIISPISALIFTFLA
jgi:hypothetical protein